MARVLVHGIDPISQAGVSAQLRGQPGVEVAPEGDAAADVALLTVDRIDDTAIQATRTLQCNGCRSVVVLTTEIDETAVLRAVEEGVVGVVRRADATPERLVEAIEAASTGGGSLSRDLLGGLLRQVRQVHQSVLVPKGLSFSGLSDREADVLRLVADGLDTREIAGELCYSERTIKNVIQDVVRRFGLRNRSHAVAFALRQGFI